MLGVSNNLNNNFTYYDNNTSLKEKSADIVREDFIKEEVDFDDKVSAEVLNDLVDRLNMDLEPLRTSLKFSVDDRNGTFKVNLIDTNKNVVIRSFPSEEAISLMSSMKEMMGVLFDEKG